MCDNVIDIILGKLDLEDLVNVSDTNKRLKNIASSVFSRKFAHRSILFEKFESYPNLPMLKRYRQSELDRNKPTVKICDARIWFKLLRNFGEFIKFIDIILSPIKSSGTDDIPKETPIALEKLIEYIDEYCSDSLEKWQLINYPYISLKKPLMKLQEFCYYGHVTYENGDAWIWEDWNTEILVLMPNLHSIALDQVPKSLQNNFPKLERISLEVDKNKEVRSLISFLDLNRQITYMNLVLTATNNVDLLYSSIEKNLTRLKIFKVAYCPDRDHSRAMERISPHQFSAVHSFCWDFHRDINDAIPCSFEFSDLKKIHLKDKLWDGWVDFVLKNRKLNIFKYSMFYDPKWVTNYGRNFKRLTGLPNLEYLIFCYREEISLLFGNVHAQLKELLSSDWELIEVKQEYRRIKSKFQRISKDKMMNKNASQLDGETLP